MPRQLRCVHFEIFSDHDSAGRERNANDLHIHDSFPSTRGQNGEDTGCSFDRVHDNRRSRRCLPALRITAPIFSASAMASRAQRPHPRHFPCANCREQCVTIFRNATREQYTLDATDSQQRPAPFQLLEASKTFVPLISFLEWRHESFRNGSSVIYAEAISMELSSIFLTIFSLSAARQSFCEDNPTFLPRR